ncbi:MAG: tryptophan synthase subunit alpha [Lachnospiraceae bacterium]|nr:tryptophan synthase subunit alpha [Lachnospiraceae bacterium]MBR4540635.1 tryptophan synthase subunit alpha [Lachnospiraceae bacterium]
MSRIANAFNNKKAFIAFLTAGDPDYETSLENFKAVIEAGADLIEVGIPFSDPIAEGPVIQEADIRALASGMTTDRVFGLVHDIRKEYDIPIVFMTYANPVYHYSADKFFKNAADAGADGIIIPDCPYEERGEFEETAAKYGIDFISMIAPTSEDRIKTIASQAKGFIYVVSSLGVTGVRSEITTDLDSIIKLIKESSDTPAAIGFGISTPEQAAAMSKKADGVIVGSAMVRIVAQYGKEAPAKLSEYVKSMTKEL